MSIFNKGDIVIVSNDSVTWRPAFFYDENRKAEFPFMVCMNDNFNLVKSFKYIMSIKAYEKMVEARYNPPSTVKGKAYAYKNTEDLDIVWRLA